MALFLAGVNPRRSDFVRASFLARSPEARRGLLRASWGHRAVSETLLLCGEGRLEWYAELDEGVDGYEAALQVLSAACGFSLAGALYFAEGADAAGHLLAAVAGLDEFAGEDGAVAPRALDAACAEARAAGCLGKGLDGLARAAGALADALAKADSAGFLDAQADTAVRLAQRVFGHVERRSVLAVGESSLSLAVSAALARAGVEDFALMEGADRSGAAAGEGARTASPEALEVLAATADVVLAGSPVEGAVLDRRLLRKVARARRGRPTLLLDCSADGALIDGKASSVDGMFLYTGADLESLAHEAPWGAGEASPRPAASREALLAEAAARLARERLW